MEETLPEVREPLWFRKGRKRLDGRNLLTFRTLKLICNVLDNAEGSAEVQMGSGTRVVASVNSFPKKMNTIIRNSIDINLSLQTRNRRKERYWNSILVQWVGHVVDLSNGITNSGISITVTTLTEDGSVLSVCFNAIMAALLCARVPCKTTALAVSLAVLPAHEHITGLPDVDTEQTASCTFVDPTAEELVWVLSETRKRSSDDNIHAVTCLFDVQNSYSLLATETEFGGGLPLDDLRETWRLGSAAVRVFTSLFKALVTKQLQTYIYKL